MSEINAKKEKKRLKDKWHESCFFKGYISISEWICRGEQSNKDNKYDTNYKHRRKIAVTISMMVVFLLVLGISLAIKSTHMEAIKNVIDENECDILICQITGSLLILSVVSLLNEKGKQVYWTNTMEYMFKRPVVLGIRAITSYVMGVAVLSMLSFLMDWDILLFISFIFSNIFLVIIIIRFIKVYYDKERVLESLRYRFYAMDNESKIEIVKKMRTCTIEAFMNRASDVYVENCCFLMELFSETKEQTEENNLSEEARQALMSIFAFSFESFRDDWADFYLKIYEEIGSVFYEETCFSSYWCNFMEKNCARLFYHGVYKEPKNYSDVDIAYDEHFSVWGNMVLDFFAYEDKQNIETVGIELWYNPNCFDTYFAKTLFFECIPNVKDAFGRKYIIREDIIEKLLKWCSSESLLGYYFTVWVLNKKVIEKKFSEGVLAKNIQENFRELIGNVLSKFYEILDVEDKLEINDGLEDLSKHFIKELEEKYKRAEYVEYDFGTFADRELLEKPLEKW